MSYRGFTIVLAGVLVATCAGARATAIVFDASSSATDADTSSWSHTVGSGADRILVVGVIIEAADGNITSITYGGEDLTEAAGSRAVAPAAANTQSTVLYYLLNPASGDANIEISFVGSNSQTLAGAVSLENVKQQGPEAAANSTIYSTATISTDITTLTDGAWVVDVVGVGQSVTTLVPDTMVERYSGAPSSAQGAGSTQEVPTAGLTTIGWTASSAPNRMGHSVAAFAPVPEPATLALLAVGGVAILIRRRRRRT